MNWKRITDQLPKPDQEVLVYCMGSFLVAKTEIYDEEQMTRWKELADDTRMSFTESHKQHLRTCPGRFREFGLNYHFDDPEVFWTELPEPPKV